MVSHSEADIPFYQPVVRVVFTTLERRIFTMKDNLHEMLEKIAKITATDKIPEFKPKKGDKYYYIDAINFGNNATGFRQSIWKDTRTDEYLYKCGNVFKTPMEAKKHVARYFLRAITERYGVFQTLLPDEDYDPALDELINALAKQEMEMALREPSNTKQLHLFDDEEEDFPSLDECYRLFKRELAKRIMTHIEKTFSPEEIQTIRGIKIHLEVIDEDEYNANIN